MPKQHNKSSKRKGNNKKRSRDDKISIMRAPRIPTHSFVRSVHFSNTLYNSGGWGSSPGFGADMEFTFSLKQLVMYLNGVSTSTTTVPNYTEFTNLFTEWKLNKIRMKMYFSNNNSSVNSPATALPLINVVFDPTNANATSLDTALQFDNLKTFQLGNAAEAPPILEFHPRPNALAYDGVSSGYITDSSGWVSCQYPDVPHYCVKVIYDGTTAPGTSTLIGSVNFYFELFLSMKGTD
jgi:hypothetical protein